MKRRTSKSNLVLSIAPVIIVLVCSGYMATMAEAGELNRPPKGFVALFNGRDLAGWKGLVGDPKTRREMSSEELVKAQAEADEDMRAHWKVVDGALCFDGKGHSLCTAKDYGDFEMFVDWKIEKGGDSGIYLRGSPQVQIWDTANRNVGAQVGSGGLYNNKKGPSKPSKRVDKPVGQWNTFRIIMMGELVTIYLNDVLVVENVVMENYWERDKPIYSTGQIELQEHGCVGSRLYFRNVFIREIPREKSENKLTRREKAKGFVRLFNGEDLAGWKGLVGDPKSRRAMSREKLARAQAKADEEMRAHWKVVDGVLCFDGKGQSLCTAKDYGDFEMFVDWKIEAGGDSGIYLRGSPQVQIWDWQNTDIGSGGLYNNQKGASKPLKRADKLASQWNTFRIIMIGERVTVYLNDELVVDNVVMENYWEQDKPIYPNEQIELQSHDSPLYFRNVFIREITNKLTEQEEADGFKLLFNGKDLKGWQGNTLGYVVKDGMIVVEPGLGRGDLYTAQEYGNFIMRFEFKLTPGANNGLGIRTPMNVDAAYHGMELQILDNTAEKYKDLRDYQFHGSIYGVVPAKRGYLKPVGMWNFQEVIANGKQITVKLNGTTIVDADISKVSDPKVIDRHPGLNNEKGYIAFCGHGDKLAFRSLRIKILK